MSTLPPPETVLELTCWSEDPASSRRFPGKTGQSPRTPSVVFRTSELSPGDGMLGNHVLIHQHTRTVSPSTHPRPYVRQATDFLLASALFCHRPTFGRPAKKTRDASNRLLPPIRMTCTRTSCVPDSLRGLLRVDAPRTLRLRRTFGGPSVSRHPRPLRRTVPAMRTSMFRPSRAFESSAGVFFPRHSGDRASGTPVAPSHFILSASSSFPDVACFFVLATRPRFYGLEWIGGCGGRQAHRLRRLVKADAPFWTGIPSIDRDPS